MRCNACILMAVVALAACTASADVNVTFKLNTSTVNAYDITTASVVQVRGSIAPITWGNDSVNLTQVDGDYWEAVVPFPDAEVGNTLEYKFYAGDEFGGWEDGDNKTLEIPATDTELELVYYNMGATPPFTPTEDIDLWFRINMESNAIFQPGVHEVGMRGGVAADGSDIGNLSWGANVVMAREAETFYHSGQVTVPVASAGTVIGYKFVRGAGPDEWEGIDNRMLTIPAEDMTVVWAWWNNEEPSPAVIDTGDVVFQADMTQLLADGWFDPGTEWISVRGGFEGWGNSEPMIPDLLQPTLYKWPYNIIAPHETVFGWKFKAFPDDNWLDSGWEIGANHEFTFVGDMELPARVPNIFPSGEPITRDVTCRFSVDVTNANCWYTGEPFPSISSVWLAGDDGTVGPLQWPGTWTPEDTTDMIRMYDDGTNGDQVAGDQIWTSDVLLPENTLSTILYKYGVYYPGVEELNDGVTPMDNEAGFAMNHVGVLSTTEQFQELAVVFADQSIREITGAPLPQVAVLGNASPNPCSEFTVFRYDLPAAGDVELAIYDVAGRQVSTLFRGIQDAGVYMARWNARDTANQHVANGTYLVKLQAQGSSLTTRVVVLR
ncbi:T9SS type A sorting domain-containing protein [Candidatus Fermentibacteria bacterium]|nr:T9SS type A sorting domain-containing protein [Candidatus Fermentibacteria bacterium]